MRTQSRWTALLCVFSFLALIKSTGLQAQSPLPAPPSPPFRQCPAAGLDTSCRILIYIDPTGAQSALTDPNVSPTYDGSDDTLIGVLNMSPNPVSSIPLTSTDPIFGFDGDGICSSSITPNPAGCPFGPTGYEGLGVSFASISADTTSGVVNFSPALRANGGSAFFGLEQAIPTKCVDTDGDGLCDDWERNGLTVYVNGAPVFVDLPAMGADPNHKDIFVQADYMVSSRVCVPGTPCVPGHSHKPSLQALALIAKAFANAPVTNPDGTNGVHLHVDCGPDCVMNPVTGATWGALSQAHVLPHTDTLGSTVGNDYVWDDFDVLKRANFSSARQQVFHYLVFAHNLGGLGGTSGISRGIPASDFIVSLGSWTNMTGTAWQQGGTFMHELGHNLSLQHGGSDGTNYKPNFLSVMDYLFQTEGLTINGAQGHFDYSRFLLPALNETSLNENAGLNGGAPISGFGTKYFCQGSDPNAVPARNVLNANGPIDWNCNGRRNETGVSTDINADTFRSMLSSFDDWQHIIFTGGSIGGLGLSLTLPAQTIVQPELTPQIDANINANAPLRVAVTGPGALQVLPGTSLPLTFTITNTGANADTYALTPSASVPWASLTGVPASVSLASGGVRQVTVPLVVPSGTPAGAAADLTLTAVSQTNSLLVDEAVARITVATGAPRLGGAIFSHTNAGDLMTVRLQLTNQGPGPAFHVQFGSFTARVLSGSGAISVRSPSLPYAVGNLGVGADGAQFLDLTLNVPASVTRFTLIGNGTVQDSNGGTFSFSISEVVQR